MVMVMVLPTMTACGADRDGEEVTAITAVPAGTTATPTTAVPAETTVRATPTAIPTAIRTTATPETATPAVPRRERLGRAGVIYDPPLGFGIEYNWHKVTLRPRGADPSVGPLIEIDSDLYLCGGRVPIDGQAALEEALFYAAWRLDAVDEPPGDPATVSMGRMDGLMAEMGGKRDGVPVRMRVYALKPGPTRILSVTGLAPADRYGELVDTLEGMVASMDVLAWETFTYGNDVEDVAFFDGYLWTATGGGVVAWPLGGGILPVKYTVQDGLPANAATALAVCPVMGAPTLFVGTWDSGVARFDPGRRLWVSLDDAYAEWSDSDVRALTCVLDNRLVVGYEDGGVDILNLDEVLWYHFGRAEGVPGNLRALTTGPEVGQVWVIGEDDVALISGEGLSTGLGDPGSDMLYQGGADGSGNLWLAAYTRVARRSAAGEWTYVDNQDVPDLFDTSVTALALAGDDTVWLGSYGQVARFDPRRGEVIDLHRREPGMVVGTTRALTVDPVTGWIGYGVAGAGASVLKEGEWLPFVLEDEPVLDSRIRTLAQDNEGRIWYGDRWGRILAFQPGEVGPPRDYFQLTRGFPLSMYADPEGGVWVGHFDGVTHYTPDGVRNLTLELPELADQYVRAIARDAQGRLWLGSDEGLFVGDEEHLLLMSEADGLPGVQVRALQPDGEAMWVGTTEGLARIAEGNVTVIGSGDSALPEGIIGALALDPWGDLLVGAGSALLAWDDAAAEFRMLLDIYGDVPVSGIAVDRDGEIWVTTGGEGVYALLFQGEAAEWQHFTGRDGIPSNTYGPHAVLIDGDGVVWLGGADGGLGRYGP